MYLRSEKRGKQERKVRVEFSAVSVPLPILEKIDKLIEELGYWPSRSSFVREACLEKIQRERERLKRLKEG
jgi:Arc/MetJ-type ribon-helix-helix transcriptional regulator